MSISVDLDRKEFLPDEVRSVKKALEGLEVGRPWNVEDPLLVASVLRSIVSAVEEKVHLTEIICNAAGHTIFSQWKKECYPYVPEAESQLTTELNKLANKWRSELSPEDAGLFNMDGFYRYYSEMPLKVLFVGREACCVSGKNYMDVVGDALRKDRFSEGWSVNRYPFHRRQFYIAYGLLYAAMHNGVWPEWNNVPSASQMAKSIFSRPRSSSGRSTDGIDSISWAFINLSKISNDSGDWRTNQARYRGFVEKDANGAHLKEQIKLLCPDIIIGANVYDVVPILGYSDKDCDDTNPACYYYPAANGYPPFLNCYHFSAIKSDKECFFDAVRMVLDRHRQEMWLG